MSKLIASFCKFLDSLSVNFIRLSIKVFVCSLLAFQSWQSTTAQPLEILLTDSLSLPPLPELEASLQRYHNRLWTAERSEYTYKQKNRFFNYLPSVSFIPLSRSDRVSLTPVLSLNTNSIFSYLQQKRQQKARLQTLDRKAQLQFNEDLTKLHLLYARIQHETATLSQNNILAELEKKQFAIYSEAFTKRELSPLNFLEKEKHYQAFLLSLHQKQEAIYLLILEIKQLARYQMADVELALPDEGDCISLTR